MNLRPRCETFLPLATQQMRLRNLVRIEGVNIVYGEGDDCDSGIFYTLHHRHDSEAFYKSEILPHRNRIKWAEISNEGMSKSNANCVCVKVWIEELPKSCISTHNIKVEHQQIKSSRAPSSKLLFTWGVYFSGLVNLNQKIDIKNIINTLIFQINGNLFGSPAHFATDAFVEKLRDNGDTSDNGLHMFNDDTSVHDISNKEDKVFLNSKNRYTRLYFPRKSVRNGYNLEKILRIQELQRVCEQRKRDSEEIKMKIKQRSIRCITPAEVLKKQRYPSISLTSNHLHYSSMGRTLSILLAEEQHIDPGMILRTREIQTELETMHSKRKLLQIERDTYADRISHQKSEYKLALNTRLHRQSWLSEQTAKLEKEREELRDDCQAYLSLLLTKRSIMQNVERRMSALCLELRDIYPIEQKQYGFHTICNIPILNMDAYAKEIKYANNLTTNNISPMALSASLGYIAHLVHMISVIINRPLRNPIICEGSRSRIIDHVKGISPYSREFPLYSRSTILSKLVKYAIILLNQNIAQLCYDISGIHCDLQATVQNILIIFSTLTEVEQNQLNSITRCCTHPNNRIVIANALKTDGSNIQNIASTSLCKSHSSVELNHIDSDTNNASMVHFLSSPPIPISDRYGQPRISRSVGSYSDCEDERDGRCTGHDIILSNSDSNIPSFQSETV